MGTETLGAENVVWDLSALYTGADDEILWQDVEYCRTRAKEISQKYRGRIEQIDPGELCELVKQLEAVDQKLGRLGTFAYLCFATSTDNPKASFLLQQIEELSAEVGRLTVFFRLEWNRMEEGKATVIMNEPSVAGYSHYLSSLRKFAPHQLSDKEEELLQEFSPVGRGAWNVLFDKLFGNLKFGEAKRTEEEVLGDLYSPDRDVRKQAAEDLTEGLRGNAHLLSHIYNTLAAEKMIDDKVRKFNSWNSAINLENELKESTVDALIEAVTGRYEVVHRYYRAKKQLLGYDELFDYDRYAPVPGNDNTLIPWDVCKQIVLEAFEAFSPAMGEIGERFFSSNWIHAPVMQGKRGGAFAHPCTPDVHPYVMVNYTGSMRDVSTVAHELGHGVHQFLAAKQGYYNSDTPLVLAETASVFAEFLVFSAQVELMNSPEAKRAFICGKLESIFATVFRQVAMNRFEHMMHTGRREKGELAADELSAFWLATQKAMFGDSVTLTENYSTWWSYIPHFLSTPGYVYSYAFGELLVLALYSLYQRDGEGFVAKYLDLLAAGGSQSPYELLLPFDIDLNDPGFWDNGLQVIEELLAKVES